MLKLGKSNDLTPRMPYRLNLPLLRRHVLPTLKTPADGLYPAQMLIGMAYNGFGRTYRISGRLLAKVYQKSAGKLLTAGRTPLRLLPIARQMLSTKSA